VIKISVDWRGKRGFENLIRYVQNNTIYGEMQIQAQILAHHSADKMIDTIIEYRKRPEKNTGKLEGSITAERISTTGGVEYGIGNIAKMNIIAPYWEMLNDGATYITRKEHIVPFEDGEFRTFKVGSSHVIEGIDFVGRSIRNLEQELRDVLQKLGTDFINGMQRESR
jgi:hypothetical protein